MNCQASVSIIVPAYNEEDFIAGCIESIQSQDYDSSLMEIIVADNGSTDSTLEIVNDLGIRSYVIPNVKVGDVRNFGVNQSSGEIVAFVDSDCLAPPNWLSSGVSELASNPNVGAVGGTYVAHDCATWMEKAWASGVSAEKRETNSLAGGSFIITRKLFLELGGFDGSLSAGEDDELSHRILAAGKALLESPQCAVVHLGWPRSLWQVFRRQVWQGSNQIEAAGRSHYMGLLLVHVFTFFLLISLGLVISNQMNGLLGLGVLPIILVPIVAALKKGLANTTARPNLISIGQLFLIFVFYYLGRAVGLFLNYYSRITKHAIKIFK